MSSKERRLLAQMPKRGDSSSSSHSMISSDYESSTRALDTTKLTNLITEGKETQSSGWRMFGHGGNKSSGGTRKKEMKKKRKKDNKKKKHSNTEVSGRVDGQTGEVAMEGVFDDL